MIEVSTHAGTFVYNMATGWSGDNRAIAALLDSTTPIDIATPGVEWPEMREAERAISLIGGTVVRVTTVPKKYKKDLIE